MGLEKKPGCQDETWEQQTGSLRNVVGGNVSWKDAHTSPTPFLSSSRPGVTVLSRHAANPSRDAHLMEMQSKGKGGALCEPPQPRVWCRCVYGGLEPTAWVWQGMAALCRWETVPTATSAVGSPKPPSSPQPPLGCPSAITPYMGELSWFNTSLRQGFTF